MPRAHWKGYLRLSLVSCPIALYPAISAAERISFRQVNRQTGNRLRHQLVDSVTGDVVTTEQKGRGFEVGESQLILVEGEELETAQEQARTRPLSGKVTAPSQRETSLPSESKLPKESARRPTFKRIEPEHEEIQQPQPVRVLNNRIIEIERCVPRDEVDPRYYDTPYYVAPRDDAGQEAFAVIRESLRQRDLVGLGHVVLAKRERPIILYPLAEGLCGMTLRYAHEVRSETEYFANIPALDLPGELFDAAAHILEMKAGDFDPSMLEDRYRAALISMLKDKRVEIPREGATTGSSQNVINLMDALKRSLATERPVAPPKPFGKRSDKKRGSGAKGAGRRA